MGPAGMSNSDSKNGGSQPVEWALERIPADDAGLDFYLREYRPFRLTALQQDPQAFGSTYEREKAFGDEFWQRRLFNPQATTFVAVRRSDRRVLSATTLWRYDEPPPWAVLDGGDKNIHHHRSIVPTGLTGQGNERPLLQEHQTLQKQLYFQLTGVYTRAEARGQGLGQAVVGATIELARHLQHEAPRLPGHQEGQSNDVGCDDVERELMLNVDVYATNTVAMAFYRSCGFEVVGSRPVDEDTEPHRPELVMRYQHSP